MSKEPLYAFDGTMVGEVTECYHQDGSHYSFNCNAHTIRTILRHSNQFDEAEIATWPDSWHVWIPDSTDLYQWILEYIPANEQFAYKVRVFYSERIDRFFINKHCGHFDSKLLGKGEWFAWARDGKLIEKEVVYTAHANLWAMSVHREYS